MLAAGADANTCRFSGVVVRDTSPPPFFANQAKGLDLYGPRDASTRGRCAVARPPEPMQTALTRRVVPLGRRPRRLSGRSASAR